MAEKLGLSNAEALVNDSKIVSILFSTLPCHSSGHRGPALSSQPGLTSRPQYRGGNTGL